MVVLWNFLKAVGPMAGGAAVAFFAFPRFIEFVEQHQVLGMNLGDLFFFFFSVTAVTAGIGLLRRRKWGQVFSIFHSVVNLLGAAFAAVGLMIISVPGEGISSLLLSLLTVLVLVLFELLSIRFLRKHSK